MLGAMATISWRQALRMADPVFEKNNFLDSLSEIRDKMQGFRKQSPCAQTLLIAAARHSTPGADALRLARTIRPGVSPCDSGLTHARSTGCGGCLRRSASATAGCTAGDYASRSSCSKIA